MSASVHGKLYNLYVQCTLSIKVFFFTFVNTFLTLEFYVLQNAFKYFVVNNMGRYIFKINAAFSYDSTAS